MFIRGSFLKKNNYYFILFRLTSDKQQQYNIINIFEEVIINVSVKDQIRFVRFQLLHVRNHDFPDNLWPCLLALSCRLCSDAKSYHFDADWSSIAQSTNIPNVHKKKGLRRVIVPCVDVNGLSKHIFLCNFKGKEKTIWTCFWNLVI